MAISPFLEMLNFLWVISKWGTSSCMGQELVHLAVYSPMPARRQEVRFNQAQYLRYYQPSHFVFKGFCCKKVEFSSDISLEKIKSA